MNHDLDAADSAGVSYASIGFASARYRYVGGAISAN